MCFQVLISLLIVACPHTMFPSGAVGVNGNDQHEAEESSDALPYVFPVVLSLESYP